MGRFLSSERRHLSAHEKLVASIIQEWRNSPQGSVQRDFYTKALFSLDAAVPAMEIETTKDYNLAFGIERTYAAWLQIVIVLFFLGQSMMNANQDLVLVAEAAQRFEDFTFVAGVIISLVSILLSMFHTSLFIRRCQYDQVRTQHNLAVMPHLLFYAVLFLALSGTLAGGIYFGPAKVVQTVPVQK